MRLMHATESHPKSSKKTVVQIHVAKKLAGLGPRARIHSTCQLFRECNTPKTSKKIQAIMAHVICELFTYSGSRKPAWQLCLRQAVPLPFAW